MTGDGEAHQVDVTEIVQPEEMDGGGSRMEFTFLKLLGTVFRCVIETAEDPPVHGGPGQDLKQREAPKSQLGFKPNMVPKAVDTTEE